MAALNIHVLTCIHCKTRLPLEKANSGKLERCPYCNFPFQTFVFPAMFRPIERKAGENLLVDSDASCFYHPQKKAVIACDHCGRFLCSLCDVEFSGQHLCPHCLGSGKKKGKFKNLQNRRTLYDDLALAIAVIPILFWPITILTAPLAIFFSVRYWKTPTSIIPRTQARRIIAIIIALLQMCAWGLFFYVLSNKR